MKKTCCALWTTATRNTLRKSRKWTRATNPHPSFQLMRIAPDRLEKLVATVFQAAGCHAPEAERIGHHLVEANLAGHDSHGVIRVPPYVDWLTSGKVNANKHIEIVFENDVLAILDGQFGFGQVIGEE